MRSILVGVFLSAFSFASVAQIKGFMQKAVGDFEQLSISGWACQVGNPGALTIRVYAGDSIQTADLIVETKANKDSEKAISDLCASEGRHRFQIIIAQQTIFTHQNKKIFVEAVADDEKRQLYGKTEFKIPEHPTTKLDGFVDGIVEANNAFFVVGWACETHLPTPISLSLRTRDLHGETIEIASDLKTGVLAEQAIQKRCETQNGRHRFRIRIPDGAIEYYAARPLEVVAHAQFSDSSVTLGSLRQHKLPARFPEQQDSRPNVVIFFTDDQGYADLGVQGIRDDIQTPNIDRLAHNGARFTHGYITAPQCSPSRAAMLTGMYQNRFALDENQHIPMTREVETLATKFQRQGYTTGMMGKWHLEVMSTSREWGQKHYPDIQPFKLSEIPKSVLDTYYPHQRGFDDVFAGYTGAYVRNVNTNGRKIEPEKYINNRFRVDLVSEQSLSFLDNHWRKPFFLYVSHYAPHVPMEALQQHLDKFPEDMPQRRRYALAMMMAVDNGVGAIVDKLEAYNLLENTLIFFISDNGAPLGDDMTDADIAARDSWNGSRNDPFTGEKGMLTEGALRVPFIAHWPKQIPAGLVIDNPVSSLDAAYTAAEVAGLSELEGLDGMSLLPLINGEENTFDARPLFWRFYYQRAVRVGNWKYMQAGIKREYLFDMTQSFPESINLIDDYPEKASEMRDMYWNWASEMPRAEPLVEIPKPFAERVDLYLPTN